MFSSVFASFRLFLARFRAFFPSTLPIGRTEFEAFSSSILNLYGIKDEPAYRQMIAVNIQHLPATQHKVSKRYFMKLIKSAMSRESAYWIMKNIQDQKKKTDAEATAQLPASGEVASVNKTQDKVPNYSTNL